MLTGGCSPLVFYLQDVSQDGLGIYGIRVKATPVIFMGDLGVQDGMVHTDVLTLLHLSNKTVGFAYTFGTAGTGQEVFKQRDNL